MIWLNNILGGYSYTGPDTHFVRGNPSPFLEYNVFIFMDYTYITLKKILTTMVSEKYPMISDIKVIDDSFLNSNFKNFKIYLGVKYGDLYGYNNENDISSDIREYVKNISKYVTGGNNTTISITFFDPNN
jgi:hypothetical protein